MESKLDLTTICPMHCFWDIDMNKLDIIKDKFFLIPRALHFTKEDTFEKDIIVLEQFYTQEDIVRSLKSTTEKISNNICWMVAARYNIEKFSRWKITEHSNK